MELYMTVPIFTTAVRPVKIQQTSTQANGHHGPYSAAFTLAIKPRKKKPKRNAGFAFSKPNT